MYGHPPATQDVTRPQHRFLGWKSTGQMAWMSSSRRCVKFSRLCCEFARRTLTTLPARLLSSTAQGDIVSTLTRLISANRLPHLLFYGPPGTGKTSTVLALAKQLYGRSWASMTLELNASDDRGIDVVREQIKNFAGTRKLFSSGVKLVILDEADAMTADAQFALRRVIEKFTRTTRFCLLCNYVSKIIPALQSRCTRFRFAPLQPKHVLARFQHVVDKEGLVARLRPSGEAAILRQSGGDMRKVLNVLQACAAGHAVIDEDAVYACTGNPTPAAVRSLLDALFKKPFAESYAALRAFTAEGYAVGDLVTEIARALALVSLPPHVRVLLLDKLADVEYRLAFGTSEKLQAASLVAAFEHARLALSAGA